MPQSQRILLAEDDAELAQQVAEFLAAQGFSVAIEGTGAGAKRHILAERPDLAIVDLGLPVGDGLEVCRDVRPSFRGPILILTARADEADQVLGLDSGADDYLVKPARPRVLLARVRALLRRAGASEGLVATVLRVEGLEMNLESREASLQGARLELTTAEFDLLWLLASGAGQVVGRRFLHERLCGTEYDPVERAVDLRVSRLRHKLGPGAIKTVHGTGYLYVRS